MLTRRPRLQLVTEKAALERKLRSLEGQLARASKDVEKKDSAAGRKLEAAQEVRAPFSPPSACVARCVVLIDECSVRLAVLACQAQTVRKCVGCACCATGTRFCCGTSAAMR